MNIYEEDILDHYENPSNYGTLEDPDISYEDDNPLCGDQIRMDLEVEDGGHQRRPFLWSRLHNQPSGGVDVNRGSQGTGVRGRKKVDQGRHPGDARHSTRSGALKMRPFSLEGVESRRLRN